MSERPSAMVSYATRPTQYSPKDSRAGDISREDTLLRGTHRVIRVRAIYVPEYDKLVLKPADPRLNGSCLLQFRNATKRLESCLSMNLTIDLLVLDGFFNLRPYLRRQTRRHGHDTVANTAAPERLEWDVAISLDNPQIDTDMLLPFFLYIDAVPPRQIIFLCDNAQLQGLVAEMPSDKWGLRAINRNNMASYQPRSYLKGKAMIETLQNRCKALKNTTYIFAVDCEHFGLAPGE